MKAEYRVSCAVFLDGLWFVNYTYITLLRYTNWLYIYFYLLGSLSLIAIRVFQVSYYWLPLTIRPTISVFVIKFTMEEFIPPHEIELWWQPIIDVIEDYLKETNAYQRQEIYLLLCPCYQLNTSNRCYHLRSLHQYPYIPIPFCLRPGELDCFELAQPS